MQVYFLVECVRLRESWQMRRQMYHKPGSQHVMIRWLCKAEVGSSLSLLYKQDGKSMGLCEDTLIGHWNEVISSK